MKYQEIKSLIGVRFGRLIIVGGAKSRIVSGNVIRMVRCKCSCGSLKSLPYVLTRLRSGHTKSCGCIRREAMSKMRKTHGMSDSSLYNVRRHMLRRCRNPNCKEWKWYGGRKKNPVRVCGRWIKSFDNFYKDMGKSWRRGLTIDRKNPKLGYTPDNCRWITLSKQQRNKTNHHIVKVNGVKMILADAAELVGVNQGSLRSRLKRNFETLLIGGYSVSNVSKKSTNPNK